MFKYMSAEVAPLFVKTLKMRFTQPSDLNDPFELRPLIDFKGTAQEYRAVIDTKITETFGTADGVLSILEKQQATDPDRHTLIILIQTLRHMIGTNPTLGPQLLAAMQRFMAPLLDEITKVTVWETLWEQFQHTLGNMLGIFCLTEDPAHPLMWSHYAGQHRGIVVEFDESHPWFNQKMFPSDEFRHLVQVAYVQNPHPRTLKHLNGADVLYTKNADWAYEREWRIIRPLKDGTQVSPGKFCFDVPADTVRSIIFGCRITPTLEAEIRAAVAANPALSHVWFKRAKPGGGKIELVDATS